MFAISKGYRVSDLMPGHLVPGSNSEDVVRYGYRIHVDSRQPKQPMGRRLSLVQIVREAGSRESRKVVRRHEGEGRPGLMCPFQHRQPRVLASPRQF